MDADILGLLSFRHVDLLWKKTSELSERKTLELQGIHHIDPRFFASISFHSKSGQIKDTWGQRVEAHPSLWIKNSSTYVRMDGGTKQSRSESFTATAQINDAWVALELYIEVTFLLICGFVSGGSFKPCFCIILLNSYFYLEITDFRNWMIHNHP